MYLTTALSTSKKIVVGSSVGAPVHVRNIVDGLNESCK